MNRPPISLIAKPAPETGTDALRALALALLPHLRELLGVHQGEELVDVAETVPLPRRTVFAACRRGQIEGASRRGRRWLATKSAVDAWLRAGGPRLVQTTADDEDELESMRRSLVSNGRRAAGRDGKR